MPFGATVAGEVLQHKLDECFGKIEQIIIIADDIMIVGYKSDRSDHDQAFPNLLQTCEVWCKAWLWQASIQARWSGNFCETYTTNRCKLSKDKVSAITVMPSPTNKKQVQSCIGMINYLSKFSSRLSELAEQIRELSNWGPEHQQASTKGKKEIGSAPMLAYYNPKKQTTLQTEDSVKGLGACLLQDDRPVYFASKALTNVQ